MFAKSRRANKPRFTVGRQYVQLAIGGSAVTSLIEFKKRRAREKARALGREFAPNRVPRGIESRRRSGTRSQPARLYFKGREELSCRKKSHECSATWTIASTHFVSRRDDAIRLIAQIYEQDIARDYDRNCEFSRNIVRDNRPSRSPPSSLSLSISFSSFSLFLDG